MSYSLEKVTSVREPIYQQMHSYYHFCQNIRHMSPVTLTSKIYTLNNFILTSHLTDLGNISNHLIFEWISRQSQRGNSGRSINDRLAHLKAMLRWQRDMNLEMPQLKLALIPKVCEIPPRKVCFSREQIALVLAHTNLQTWLLIRIAFDCGLRISELQKLQIFDIKDNQITITGKGNKRRHAYLCPDVQMRLNDWILSGKIQKFLWPSPIRPDATLATCTIRAYMKQAFQKAGFNNFCPHDLRHSYATDLKKLGATTRQIQAGLGHMSEAVTEKYLSDLEGFDLRELYELKYSDVTSQL